MEYYWCMRKFLFIFSVLVCFAFCGCDLNPADASDAYVVKDYLSFVKDDCYSFPPGTDAVTFYNCFYNEFGYGEKEIKGLYSHTESAVLNGKKYSDTITKNIVKINLYSTYDSGLPSTSYFIDFTTDTGEIISFLYQWQFHITNYWSNTISDGTITIYK